MLEALLKGLRKAQIRIGPLKIDVEQDGVEQEESLEAKRNRLLDELRRIDDEMQK